MGRLKLNKHPKRKDFELKYFWSSSIHLMLTLTCVFICLLSCKKGNHTSNWSADTFYNKIIHISSTKPAVSENNHLQKNSINSVIFIYLFLKRKALATCAKRPPVFLTIYHCWVERSKQLNWLKLLTREGKKISSFKFSHYK